MSNLCSCHTLENCEWCSITSRIEELEKVLHEVSAHANKAHIAVMQQKEHIVFLHLNMIKEEIKFVSK